MTHTIVLPALGADDATVTLVQWHVAPGDRVEAGTVIAEFESDKTVVEIEAEHNGVIERLLVAEGTENIAAGTALAAMATGAQTEHAASSATPDVTQAQGETPEPQPVAAQALPATVEQPAMPARTAAPHVELPAGGATPLAARMARQSGQDLNTIRGSGHDGRVTAADLGAPTATRDATPPKSSVTRILSEDVDVSLSPVARRMLEMTGQSAQAYSGSGVRGRVRAHDIGVAFESAPPASVAQISTAGASPPELPDVPGEEVPASKLQQIVAQRLGQSKRDAPHYYMSVDVDATRLLAWRKMLNDPTSKGERPKVSLNDAMLRLVALTLVREPGLNCAWTGDGIRHYTDINVAAAVASSRGLITPVVEHADRLDVYATAARVNELVQAADNGKLTADELNRGTFTVSNLGMYGVDNFASIINPPQAAILAVGSILRKPVARDASADSQSDTVTIRPMMTCTLSVDHRAADGVAGARFLAQLKSLVEDPRRALL